jgi:hypothetical protein
MYNIYIQINIYVFYITKIFYINKAWFWCKKPQNNCNYPLNLSHTHTINLKKAGSVWKDKKESTLKEWTLHTLVSRIIPFKFIPINFS